MTTVGLVVDVDRAVRRGASTERLHARHLLQEQSVVIGVLDRGRVATRTVTLDDWSGELELLCPGREQESRVDWPGLPWELVVATGRALCEHRPDLYDVLVDRADPQLREPLRRLHCETSGRLRLVGLVPSRRRIGWASWVLLTNGWHALTPYVECVGAATRPMVRLQPGRPGDLAHEVARWVAAAR